MSRSGRTCWGAGWLVVLGTMLGVGLLAAQKEGNGNHVLELEQGSYQRSTHTHHGSKVGNNAEQSSRQSDDNREIKTDSYSMESLVSNSRISGRLANAQ